MMFTIFRFILIVFTVVQLILAVLALLGGYKTGSFLTPYYILNVNIANVPLAQMFDVTKFGKRDNIGSFGENPVTTTDDDSQQKAQTTTTSSSSTSSSSTSTAQIVSPSPTTLSTIVLFTPATTLTKPLDATTVTTTVQEAVTTQVVTNGWVPQNSIQGADTLPATAVAPAAANTVNTNTVAAGTAAATPAGAAPAAASAPVPVVPLAASAAGASTPVVGTSTIVGASAAVASAVNTATPTTYPQGSLEATLQYITTKLTHQQLGLADVYSISFWGYCKGTFTTSNVVIVNGVGKTTYDNSKVNYTWCSTPKASYTFDPVTVFKSELNDTIANPNTDPTVRAELQFLVNNVNSTNFLLPGSLNKKLPTMKNLFKASFGLVVALVVLTFISVIIGLLGCFLSPGNCMLSFLNFLYQFVIFVINVVAAGIITGASLYIKTQNSENSDTYGSIVNLSKGFYAFIWSAAVAGWFVIVFSLLGHCIGLFNTGRRYYRVLPPPKSSAVSSSSGEK